MIQLYTEEEYSNSKSEDKLSLECYFCHKPFFKEKKYIKQKITKKSHNACKYCSRKCMAKSNITRKIVHCKHCNKEFEKILAEIKKDTNNFCSRSCSATYNNTHKTHGTRVSKLEVWLQEQLTILYPNLQFDFNKKDAINSELDIYIPSLKLAFELNGIFHYEPIYGQDKLDKIQNNDQRKFTACIEQSISLCIIDSSSFQHFKPKKAQIYLDIITNIINKNNLCPL